MLNKARKTVFLGIMDKTLSWKPHIQKIENKISKLIE